MSWEEVLKNKSMISIDYAEKNGAESAMLTRDGRLIADFLDKDKRDKFAESMRLVGFNIEFREKDPYMRIIVMD
jgi:hypothetical protein